MKYKLIAIDMDGTLLNSNDQISRKTIETIRKAEEKGVKIVMATGRILKSALYYAEPLKSRRAMVAANGAIMVDKNGKVLYEKLLGENKVKEIIKIAMTEDVYFHFYGEDDFYSTTKSEEMLKYYDEGGEKIDINIRIFDDINKLLNKEKLKIYKFIFVDENKEKLKKLRGKIKQIKDIDISSSWDNNIEVMAKDVSKGKAIEKLCKKLEIRPEEVIAIGDNENDLSMMEFAGLSIAMENGIKSVKEKADYITSTNDQHGVAKAIKKFVLD